MALSADAIKDVSTRNGIVLDLFGGSGSTLIAAHKTARRGYLCELDPLYCDRTLRRWQVYARDDAILASTGQSFDEAQAEHSQPASFHGSAIQLHAAGDPAVDIECDVRVSSTRTVQGTPENHVDDGETVNWLPASHPVLGKQVVREPKQSKTAGRTACARNRPDP